MIDQGTYKARVTDHALAVTGTGTEQIAIGFDIDVPAGEGVRTESLTWYGFFTEKAYKTTERALEALGWDPAEKDFAFDMLNGTGELVGAEADVVVEHEVGQDGVKRARIRWVNAPGGGLGIRERMAPQAAATFAADLRRRVIAWKGPGASKPARPAPKPSGVDLDDIPF